MPVILFIVRVISFNSVILELTVYGPDVTIYS